MKSVIEVRRRIGALKEIKQSLETRKHPPFLDNVKKEQIKRIDIMISTLTWVINSL